jgi:hypothetical protein
VLWRRPSVFYKKSWDIVGEQVEREVLHFLNRGDMPQGWNETIMKDRRRRSEGKSE